MPAHHKKKYFQLHKLMFMFLQVPKYLDFIRYTKAASREIKDHSLRTKNIKKYVSQ